MPLMNSVSRVALNASGGVIAPAVVDPTLAAEYVMLANSLPSGLTFSRASVATDIIGGVLTTFASGAPRISSLNGLLMEEARTNILQNSYVSTVGSTFQGGATTGPDNVAASAVQMTSDAGTTTHGLSNSVSQTHSAAAYTVSAFVKAGTSNRVQLCVSSAVSTAYTNFLLSGSGSVTGSSGATLSGIIPLANGWYRIWMVYTAAAATGTPGALFFLQTGSEGCAPSLTMAGTETLYFYGLQSELGQFLTSYIPTTNANVTRATDLCYTTTIPWWTQAQGTFFAQLNNITPNISPSCWYCSLTDVTTSNYHALLMLNTLVTRGEIRQVSSNEMQADVYTYTSGRLKHAMAYAINDGQTCANGTLSAQDTTVVLPTGLTRLDIGNRYDGIRALNGYVEIIRFYNVRKSSAEMQALTA